MTGISTDKQTSKNLKEKTKSINQPTRMIGRKQHNTSTNTNTNTNIKVHTLSSRVRRTAGLEGAGTSEGKDDEDSAATGTAGGTSDAVKESAAIDEDTKWNNNEQRVPGAIWNQEARNRGKGRGGREKQQQLSLPLLLSYASLRGGSPLLIWVGGDPPLVPPGPSQFLRLFLRSSPSRKMNPSPQGSDEGAVREW